MRQLGQITAVTGLISSIIVRAGQMAEMKKRATAQRRIARDRAQTEQKLQEQELRYRQEEMAARAAEAGIKDTAFKKVFIASLLGLIGITGIIVLIVIKTQNKNRGKN